MKPSSGIWVNRQVANPNTQKYTKRVHNSCSTLVQHVLCVFVMYYEIHVRVTGMGNELCETPCVELLFMNNARSWMTTQIDWEYQVSPNSSQSIVRFNNYRLQCTILWIIFNGHFLCIYISEHTYFISDMLMTFRFCLWTDVAPFTQQVITETVWLRCTELMKLLVKTVMPYCNWL